MGRAVFRPKTRVYLGRVTPFSPFGSTTRNFNLTTIDPKYASRTINNYIVQVYYFSLASGTSGTGNFTYTFNPATGILTVTTDRADAFSTSTGGSTALDIFLCT